MLYVLAMGPIRWLVINDYISHKSALGTVVEVIYMPLAIVTEFCPPLRSFLEWYLRTCSGA